MLSFLGIKDFALIESLELEPGGGLVVLSGETGAGKSIILSALGLILGQRAAADLIRTGADSALVQAQFHLDPGGEARRILQAEELDDAEAPGELVVQRMVSRGGRNRVRINGSLVTLSLLGRLGPHLVNLCGQHAHQALLRPEEHLLLLDAFAGLEAKRREVRQAVGRALSLRRELEELRRELERLERRREELAFTVQELEEAELDPEEEQQLKAERRRYLNQEKIARLGDGALTALYTAEEGAALDILGRVRSFLGELAGLDPKLEGLLEQVEGAYYQLRDAADELQGYLGDLGFDPGRLDWIESRLASLQRLVRKYGGDVAAALETLEQSRRELASLDQGGENLAALERDFTAALDEALELARELGQERRRAAARLARAVEGELADLGMGSCRFRVEFTPPASAPLETPEGPLSPRGLEQAEFLIAPNPGEGFRPLARIASGGELSRILLALQVLVAGRRGSATQVYDEVDAGIGGATGAAVGRKLAQLSRRGQVICITHLPQIAAWADRHFVVRKRTSGGRTATEVQELDETGRMEELARMLAGLETGGSAGEHARRMLEAARREKASLA